MAMLGYSRMLTLSLQDACGNGTEVPAEQLEHLGIDMMARQPDGNLVGMPELAVVAEMVSWPCDLCFGPSWRCTAAALLDKSASLQVG